MIKKEILSMIPPHWDLNRDKPICRECGCVEFGPDMVCLGCNEPLVVRPYPKKRPLNITAAEKWGNHWPKDYEKRCFLCGWKFRRTLDSLIPSDAEELMAIGIWSEQPVASRLADIICPGKKLSERYKMIMGILANSGENALFPTVANKKYQEMATRYDGKKLSFCRNCAEQDTIAVPAELPAPNSVTITDTMADALAESGLKPQKEQGLPMKEMTRGFAPPRDPTAAPDPNDEFWQEDEWPDHDNSDPPEDEHEEDREHWDEDEEEEEEDYDEDEKEDEEEDWNEDEPKHDEEAWDDSW